MSSYWVVSPNVAGEVAGALDQWNKISVQKHVAIMGWGLEHEIGRRFFYKIADGDIVLIARRHNHRPEIVGFGVVKGPAELGKIRGQAKRTIKGVKTPRHFGSLRNLSPFIEVQEPPANVPLIGVLGQSSALAKLHPNRHGAHYRAHALVCNWMHRLLSNDAKPSSTKSAPSQSEPDKLFTPRIAAPKRNNQLDYIVRTKKQVLKAEKKEFYLVSEYTQWLKRKGRELERLIYGKLECDGFERTRCNLIEAKSSVKREYIRMAVGQLLDYAFQIEKKYGKPNMAILLPAKPPPTAVNWLSNISIIWREGQTFRDNAQKQFA